MNTQPETLRLADDFEKPYWDNGEPHGQLVKAAAELRRLHKENQALRQALAQHECSRSHPHENMDSMCELRTENARLKKALAQPEQEPVAEIQLEDLGPPFKAMRVTTHFYKEVPAVGTKLYTAPPKREWVGLTDQEIHEIVYEQMEGKHPAAGFRVANCIESKLKEKNHGRI